MNGAQNNNHGNKIGSCFSKTMSFVNLKICFLIYLHISHYAEYYRRSYF